MTHQVFATPEVHHRKNGLNIVLQCEGERLDLVRGVKRKDVGFGPCHFCCVVIFESLRIVVLGPAYGLSLEMCDGILLSHSKHGSDRVDCRGHHHVMVSAAKKIL